MNLTISSKAKLNDGNQIPYLGLGTYTLSPGSETQSAVRWALEEGYRLIDTAQFYKNEVEVGKAIKESSVPREEIFVTTKLWNGDHGYDKALKSFDESLEKLDVDYIDLFLIHWPVHEKRLDSWRALEKLKNEGRAKSIGVSNYTEDHLKEIFDSSDTIPAVNQVEFSPFLYQKELLEFCRENNIQLESYSPLTQGRKLNDKVLKQIADNYNKTPAQILIRWQLQHKIVVIPKSSKKERIQENADVFDFEISKEDMDVLDSNSDSKRFSWDPTNSRQVKRFS